MNQVRICPVSNDRALGGASPLQETYFTLYLEVFIPAYLQQFDIEPQHPDHFISSLIDLNPEPCLRAFQRQVSFLKNPPQTIEQVLNKLENSGLIETSKKLKSLGG